MSIEQRPYGNTGIMLSSLGLGALQLGHPTLSEQQAEQVLSSALDSGINLIDTAPGYHLSEQRIGKLISHRRLEYVLSTKLGYGVDGIPDWTGACITAGIEQALRKLKTDRIDIAHLHSCPSIILERGDVIDALEKAKQAGKIIAIAYSGDHEDLTYAINMDRFDGFMASLNICDQRLLDGQLASMQGKGLIAKRPTANHPWRFDSVPTGDYCEVYWHRWKAMNLTRHGLAWGELALRFAMSFEGVSSAVIGTASVQHLQESLAWTKAGALPAEWIAELRETFQQHDDLWIGQV